MGAGYVNRRLRLFAVKTCLQALVFILAVSTSEPAPDLTRRELVVRFSANSSGGRCFAGGLCMKLMRRPSVGVGPVPALP